MPIFDKLGIPTNETWTDIENHEAIKTMELKRTSSKLRDYLKDENVTDMLAIDLLEKMFVMNPKNRISVREILEHPYFSDPLNLPALKL